VVDVGQHRKEGSEKQKMRLAENILIEHAHVDACEHDSADDVVGTGHNG
jgi:hypothetical protein